jgi:hypothetical protein
MGSVACSVFLVFFFNAQGHGGCVHPPCNPPQSVSIDVTCGDSLEAAHQKFLSLRELFLDCGVLLIKIGFL